MHTDPRERRGRSPRRRRRRAPRGDAHRRLAGATAHRHVRRPEGAPSGAGDRPRADAHPGSLAVPVGDRTADAVPDRFAGARPLRRPRPLRRRPPLRRHPPLRRRPPPHQCPSSRRRPRPSRSSARTTRRSTAGASTTRGTCSPPPCARRSATSPPGGPATRPRSRAIRSASPSSSTGRSRRSATTSRRPTDPTAPSCTGASASAGAWWPKAGSGAPSRSPPRPGRRRSPRPSARSRAAGNERPGPMTTCVVTTAAPRGAAAVTRARDAALGAVRHSLGSRSSRGRTAPDAAPAKSAHLVH